MLTYVFPGQGSQAKGMGANLFHKYPELIREADNILGYSIEELCIEDSQNQLSLTQYTQPALFVVNALSYLEKIKEYGLRPDFVAGHSLGEYNALFAAEVFDFTIGLQLVKKRGELMGNMTEGGMAAVIGLKEEDVSALLTKHDMQDIDIANLNSSSQIVLSGTKSDLHKFGKIIEPTEYCRYILLQVSGAFHSRYMKEAADEFAQIINKYTFNKPRIPVISNVYARPYSYGKIAQTLIDQMTSSVKWTESICYLMGKGDMAFEQIGPGNVLTGLIRSIKRDCKPLAIEDDKINQAKIPDTNQRLSANKLGSKNFREDYGLEYAYVTGGMYRGVASVDLVEKVANAGMLSFFGTGGLKLNEIEEAIKELKNRLGNKQNFGLNLMAAQNRRRESDLINLYLSYGINHVEAAAYITMSPELVRYRIKGIKKDMNGTVYSENKILAKVSRPEVAEAFMRPAPEKMIESLLASGKINNEEAKLALFIPMADDICVEADSGGHTNQGVAYAILPAIFRLRDEVSEMYNYKNKIRIGTGGGIGTPEAVAASFIMGADFVVTGSINQATVEAGTSELAKDMIQDINIQDTEHVPSGDMFEYGAKAQVLKKGVLFPSRANKLYDCYRYFNSIDEIDSKTKDLIEKKYFSRSFTDVYEEVKRYFTEEKYKYVETNPKAKMATIFQWYFREATKAALEGEEKRKVDFQIFCGPALGAFNQWVKGSDIESWRNRHVDEIGLRLMECAANLLQDFFTNEADK